MGLETLAIAAFAVSAATSVIGGFQQAAAAKQMAEIEAINARIAAQNEAAAAEARAKQDDFQKKLTEQQIAIDRAASIAEQNEIRREEAAKRARIRAGVGGSGITFSGSPLLVEEAMIQLGEEKAERVGHGYRLRKSRSESRISLLDASAAQERANAEHAIKVGQWNAASARLAGDIRSQAAMIEMVGNVASVGTSYASYRGSSLLTSGSAYA